MWNVTKPNSDVFDATTLYNSSDEGWVATFWQCVHCKLKYTSPFEMDRDTETRFTNWSEWKSPLLPDVIPPFPPPPKESHTATCYTAYKR